MKPIVRNIKNDELYEWDGKLFTNIRTGKSGVVDDVKAREIFRFNVAATQLIHDHPTIKDLIFKLNLKLDK